MFSTIAARALSVIGHPLLLMPISVAWAAGVRGASPEVLRAAVYASLFLAISVAVFSAVQVRAGRWRHIDASVPRERGQLNIFLIALFFGSAVFLGWSGKQPAVATGVAICGGLVFFALQTSRWLKVSLHAAFAVFAAALMWPNWRAVLLLTVLAAGVSWSRLALRRHTPAEVVVGLLAGFAAGLGFNLLAA